MRITIIATGFEKKPEDATRNINTIEKNSNSPFIKKEAAAAPAPAEATVEEKPAAQPVKKVIKKPAPKKEADDFDDLFDMFKKK
jgi:hypothetical protein